MGTIQMHDMMELIETAYCEKKCVVVMWKQKIGEITLVADELEVLDSGDKVSLVDMHDTYMTIDKCSIDDISLSHDGLSDVIKLDFDSGEITLMICR